MLGFITFITDQIVPYQIVTYQIVVFITYQIVPYQIVTYQIYLTKNPPVVLYIVSAFISVDNATTSLHTYIFGKKTALIDKIRSDSISEYSVHEVWLRILSLLAVSV